jgi:hypothetical protein
MLLSTPPSSKAISAADRPTFVLGQLIIFGAIVVVALVELTLWLVN